jgi:hypothetical protein
MEPGNKGNTLDICRKMLTDVFKNLLNTMARFVRTALEMNDFDDGISFKSSGFY